MFRTTGTSDSAQTNTMDTISFAVVAVTSSASAVPQSMILDMQGFHISLPYLKSYSLKEYTNILSLELIFQSSQNGWTFHKSVREEREFTSNHLGEGVVILKPRSIAQKFPDPAQGYFMIKDILSSLQQKFSFPVLPESPTIPEVALITLTPPKNIQSLASASADTLEENKKTKSPPKRPEGFFGKKRGGFGELKIEIFADPKAEKEVVNILKPFLEAEVKRLQSGLFTGNGATIKKNLFDCLLKRIDVLSLFNKDSLTRFIKECAMVAFHKRHPTCDYVLHVTSFGLFGGDSDSWKAWKKLLFNQENVYKQTYLKTLESPQGRLFAIADLEIKNYDQYTNACLK